MLATICGSCIFPLFLQLALLAYPMETLDYPGLLDTVPGTTLLHLTTVTGFEECLFLRCTSFV